MTYVPPTDNPTPEKLRAMETTDPERALVEYANRNELEGVQRLLAAGVKPDVRVLFDVGFEKVSETPLCTAAANGHIAAAAALIAAGASLEFTGEVDFTPLHNAAAGNQAGMVRFLINSGANMAAQEDAFLQTPLHLAARHGFVDCVNALVELGADRFLADKNGRRADEIICTQAGGSVAERTQRHDGVTAIFAKAAARDAEAAQRHADELANAPVLQRSLKPLKTIRFGRS